MAWKGRVTCLVKHLHLGHRPSKFVDHNPFDIFPKRGKNIITKCISYYNVWQNIYYKAVQLLERLARIQMVIVQDFIVSVFQ